ncbi:unnamed protein product [Porites lobata]|uniref:Uncharacterized protein n=1 Tax=Porites lobata TaxID=104759 RepID=A0ABN8SCZ9_9CNID|nr:unnamed protein product [Porites lobata]
MACGVHAREIEESTITSVLNECLRDFPHIGALKKEQNTGGPNSQDLPCELGAWKRCFCNPAHQPLSCLITKWQ